MTISEEFSDRQNSLSINLMMKWELKYLSFSSSSADITATAIIATTQVEVARMGTIEVMGLIEPDTVVKISKEIPIIAIGTACDGIDILHIPRDKITDNGRGSQGKLNLITTTIVIRFNCYNIWTIYC